MTGGAAALHSLERRGRRGPALAALAAIAGIVAGCATVSVPPPSTGEVLSGRLALRIEASGREASRSFLAAFDLRGSSSDGTLGLSTPLGSMLAQARWSAADVVLTTPQGARVFASLDELTREVLGESVPLEAWFDWLRGRPWPGAPSETAANGFSQLGWNVDLAGFAEGAVAATRAAPPPVVTVRIRLDRS